MKLQAMDPSHVAFVYLKLNLAFFEQYDCRENVDICFNVAELMDFLKSAQSDDTVILWAYKGKDHVKVQFVPTKGSKNDWVFALSLMNASEETSFTVPVNYIAISYRSMWAA